MAIAVGSQTHSTSSSYSFNNVAGNLLIAGITGAVGSDNLTAAPTYNGVAMTLVSKVLTPSDRYIYLYCLVSPATGSHTFAVSFSSGYLSSFLVSYTGSGTGGGQPDSNNNGTASAGASLTVSTTVVDANCWLVGMFNADATAMSAGTGTTAREVDTAQPGGLFDSNGTVGTGSQGLQVTMSPNRKIGGIVASITPLTHQLISVSDTVGYAESTRGNLNTSKADTISFAEVASAVRGITFVLLDTISFVESLVTRFGWKNLAKSATSSMANLAKHASSVANQAKSAVSSWVNGTKN